MPKIARSLLFVPGSRPDRYDKALASGADAVVVDLEDAVAPADKGRARDALTAWLTADRAVDRAGDRAGDRVVDCAVDHAVDRAVILRINGADTDWFRDDLALCALPGVAAVMLPKAERTDDIAALRAAGAKAIVPLVESGAGFAALTEIAVTPGVQRLAFGSLDLQIDLGMRGALEDDLLLFRSQLVLASRLAGLQPPVDGVTTAIDDAERLRDDVLRARRLGFGGKLCIHPRQVADVNRHFAPTEPELAWARRVLDAAAASGGSVVALDGQLIDKPVILRAQAILRDAHHDSQIDPRKETTGSRG